MDEFYYAFSAGKLLVAFCLHCQAKFLTSRHGRMHRVQYEYE